MIEIIQKDKPTIFIHPVDDSGMHVVQEQGKEDRLISDENLLKSFKRGQ
jgi:hypothetical protein